MAGSPTEEQSLPTNNVANRPATLAILLICPSGEEPPEANPDENLASLAKVFAE